jgi:hypothetical protein
MWEDNIKVYLKEIDKEAVTQDRVQWYALVNMIMNPQVPREVRDFLTR